MGAVICIGCREPFKQCACSFINEAESAQQIAELSERRCYKCGRPGDAVEIQDVFDGGPMCIGCVNTLRRCYKCDDMKRIDYSVTPTEMCFDCAKEA